MKVRVLAAKQDMIAEVAAHLRPDGADYSSALIVFPGKRPAHFLRKALASAAGSAILPPQIVSMDGFVDLVHEESGPHRKADALDAVAILYDINRTSLRPLGGGSFLDLDRFFPIGLKIFRDIEELSIEGVPASRVKEIDRYAAEKVPEYSLHNLQSLSTFSERFYERIADAGLSTRSLRYRSVAEALSGGHVTALSCFSQIVFAGFFVLTEAEQRIFRSMYRDDRAVFFFRQGEGLAERLAEIGFEAAMPETMEEPVVRFSSSPDAHGQVLAVGAILRRGSSYDEKTAIVLPTSDSLFPLIRQGIPFIAEGSYNISMGHPLQRTPIFGFLSGLMQVIVSMDRDRVYVPAYLNFLLHPYTKNIFFRGGTEVTRILCHAIEEDLSGPGSKTFLSLEEIEERSDVFRIVGERISAGGEPAAEDALRSHLREIHDQTVRQFLAFSSVKDFAGKCLGLLTFIYDNSSARLHPLFHPFAEAFSQALEAMARSLLKDNSFADPGGYFSLLRRSLAAGRVPFDGTPVQGLQILGLLETRALSFDRVFVLDVNEGILPASDGGDSLLPFRARQMLGLPTHHDRGRLAAYYFDVLVQGAREVHLFSVENDTKERSRFAEQLLWQRQRQDGTTGEAGYVLPVQYRVSLATALPAPVPKTPEVAVFLREKIFTATALDTYLRCPLEFYYGEVLGLGRKEELSGDIGRADIGILVHEILKVFFSERIGRHLTDADIDETAMEAVVNDQFIARYGRDLVGPHYLLKLQVLKQMQSILQRYYRPLVADVKMKIVACESCMTASPGAFRLKGRIDCIEEREGRHFIVDYKTGAAGRFLGVDMERLDPKQRETWPEAIGSLQLPFYLILAAEGGGLDPDNLEALYLLLGRSAPGRAIEQPLFPDGGGGDSYRTVREVVLALLAEIVDPSVPFAPDRDARRTCPACDFRHICGTQWAAAGR